MTSEGACRAWSSSNEPRLLAINEYVDAEGTEVVVVRFTSAADSIRYLCARLLHCC